VLRARLQSVRFAIALRTLPGPLQQAAYSENQTPNPDGEDEYLLALPIQALVRSIIHGEFPWLTTEQKTQPASTIFHTEIDTIIH
jgi:hypothetical protein